MFFFSLYGDHRDLHVLTHSFPTRRSSDLVMLNRNEYWQIASVIAKGAAQQWRQQPIERFQAKLGKKVGFLTDRVNHIASWDDIKLLEVRVDRLPCWHKPGLLLIGDDRKSTRLNSSH